MPSNTPRIGIVGARGAVGTEARSILAQRGLPADSVVCFGSARSEGTRVQYGTEPLTIQPSDSTANHELDYILCCADAQAARNVTESLHGSSTTIIDNSSAFRADPDVPLVIPEINADLLTADTRLVANPNCSTIMMLRALDPIRQTFGIQRVCTTTYQAVSGAGRAGIEELHNLTRAYLDQQPAKSSVFPVSCAFNVFEHESSIDPQTGFNGEESKMISETRKIWGIPNLSILPTCVRVPVERAHAQSIIVDLKNQATLPSICEVLRTQSIRVLEPGMPLTPHDAAGGDDVVVGRIRIDPQSQSRRVSLWICCDQIRKGAALNAIQIMDRLVALRHNAKKEHTPGVACAEEQNRKVLA